MSYAHSQCCNACSEGLRLHLPREKSLGIRMVSYNLMDWGGRQQMRLRIGSLGKMTGNWPNEAMKQTTPMSLRWYDICLVAQTGGISSTSKRRPKSHSPSLRWWRQDITGTLDTQPPEDYLTSTPNTTLRPLLLPLTSTLTRLNVIYLLLFPLLRLPLWLHHSERCVCRLYVLAVSLTFRYALRMWDCLHCFF